MADEHKINGHGERVGGSRCLHDDVLAAARGRRARALDDGGPGGVATRHPLADPDSPQIIELRDEARATLLELGSSEGLDVAEARVIAGNFAGRELHRLTELPTTGLIVVGSTTRGPIGRLLLAGIAERLLAGAACPVAIAPRGYDERDPSRLTWPIYAPATTKRFDLLD